VISALCASGELDDIEEAADSSREYERSGKVWIFGMKAENPSTDSVTTGGGSTEILGLFTCDNRSLQEYSPGSL
jgi:hypothetical protein